MDSCAGKKYMSALEQHPKKRHGQQMPKVLLREPGNHDVTGKLSHLESISLHIPDFSKECINIVKSDLRKTEEE